MTTADTFLVCWCLLTSCFWSVYASPSSRNCCEPYDFSGPSDVLFLIDRSASVSKSNFEDYKGFIHSLVTKAMKIGPYDVTGNENYSRMGVITFAANVSIDLNLMPDSQNVSLSDVLTAFNGSVTFIENQIDNKHTGFKAALKKVPELLRQRQFIDRQLLFIVSDFHELLLNETKTHLETLFKQFRNHTLKVFGVGGGQYFNLANMLDLLGNCTALSQEDWKTYVEELPSLDDDSRGLLNKTDRCCQLCSWSVIRDASAACPLCREFYCSCQNNTTRFFHPNGSICQQSSPTCDEGYLNHTSPRPHTTQPPDVESQDPSTPEGAWSVLLASTWPQTAQPPDDESQDPIIPHWASAVIVFMGGVVLAMAIMAGVTKWRRKNTRPSADAVELSEPRAAGRSPLGPQPSIHLHLNIGSLSELRRPSPSPVRLPITGPSTQTMTSEFGAAAPEQPSAGGQSPSGPESSALPKVNTTWNRRQQHPSPPPVRTTARVPKGPPPLPQHPPPHPVRQPPTTLTSFDEWYPEQTSFDEWFPEQTSFDEGYVKPSKPPPHDRDMPDSYAHTLPGSVFLAGGNHSTQRESSHAYEDMVGPRTVPRRQTLIDILNQVNSVRRNLSIWFSQK